MPDLHKRPCRFRQYEHFSDTRSSAQSEDITAITRNLETQTTSIKSFSASTWIVRPKPLLLLVFAYCVFRMAKRASAFRDWLEEVPEGRGVYDSTSARGARMLEPPRA
jgi:hypothetical protein